MPIVYTSMLQRGLLCDGLTGLAADGDRWLHVPPRLKPDVDGGT